MKVATKSQQAIVDYLAAHPGRLVGGYEIRDAVCPTAGVKTVHVQVHNLRALGVVIESRRSSSGGYRLVSA